MYALFETEFGIRMVRAQERLRAVNPSNEEAQLLQIDQHMPLLSVERLAFTYHDTPMEWRRALNRTDTHYYDNELN
jgi:GntR family transcriptional regulator